MTYAQFIERKSQAESMSGFDPKWIPDFLFDFQRSLVEWAIRKGRAAIFADCGLGKTAMQLVWAENVVRHTRRPVLVMTPLAIDPGPTESAFLLLDGTREAGCLGRQMIDAKPTHTPARLAVEVSIRTVSEANSHEHWRYRSTRAKRQRTAVALLLSGQRTPALPVRVTMTRLAPRRLDDDNLTGSMKHVRDEVARCLGIDDRDPRVKWVCEQERAKGYAVRIEIVSAA